MAMLPMSENDSGGRLQQMDAKADIPGSGGTKDLGTGGTTLPRPAYKRNQTSLPNGLQAQAKPDKQWAGRRGPYQPFAQQGFSQPYGSQWGGGMQQATPGLYQQQLAQQGPVNPGSMDAFRGQLGGNMQNMMYRQAPQVDPGFGQWGQSAPSFNSMRGMGGK